MIEWGSASIPLAGELTSGDLAVVCPFRDGALLALIDGLGHGAEAADVAKLAANVLAAEPMLPVEVQVARCHQALKRTRGIVLSLASIADASASLDWLGVGNVEGVVVRAPTSVGLADETLATRGGTVGYLLPPLNPRTLPLMTDDLIVFASDGIRSEFRADIATERSPTEIARAILASHSKQTDDACVLVVRFLGKAVT